MIKASDAVETARSLLGTPYSDLDCIGLVREVIQCSPGGRRHYTTAGTNALWDSINSSAKYKDLTMRHHGIKDAHAGMLAFKISRKPDGTEDVHHVGLVTGDGTVIHSSGPRGPHRCVVETPLDGSWDALAVHRYIEIRKDKAMKTATVCLKESRYLYMRVGPGTEYESVGSIPQGSVVEVKTEGRWPFVSYNGQSGYVCGEYLVCDAEPVPSEPVRQPVTTTLVNHDGTQITLLGIYRVLED